MKSEVFPKTFVIIDSNALIHRAYHALPRLTTRKGELVNAAYGFTLLLLKVLREVDPDYIAAAFDVAGPTFRSQEYREYKAKRVKAPDELYAQIPIVKKILDAFHIPIYEYQGFEADDIIGTLVKQAPRKQKVIPLEIVIVTGDLDALGLVNEHTKVYTLRKGFQDTVLYGEKEVVERYGLVPDQLADLRGLRGDQSDNIIGVPGIGEKTAVQILQEFKTIEGLYSIIDKHDTPKLKPRILELLRRHKDDAFFSRMLATIRTDAPVKFSLPASRWKEYDPQEVKTLFLELGFLALLKRLPGQEDAQNDQTPTTNDQLNSKFQIPNSELEQAYRDGVLSKKIYELEKQVTPVLQKMHDRGVRIDKRILEKLQKEMSATLHKKEKAIYKAAGEEFNINSPSQIGHILFDKLQLSTKGISKTPGGEISTAASELEKLRDKHPVVDFIFEYRELQKLLSTYVIPLQEQTDAQGRIHTTFHQLGAATGRLSSSDPNLQNIPMRSLFAQEIRRAFIPSEGKKFLSADYSQMELRVVAHLAQDKEMMKAFEEGDDIHRHTAAVVFGVEESEVTPNMRFRAKALNFGLIYGIGVQSFGRSANLSRAEAKEFMDKYMSVFKGVADFMERTKREAHRKGYVETPWGRKRFFPDLNSPNPMIRAAAERAAINMPVQGMAADIVKLAMVEVEKKFPQLSLLLQVHDELVWEAEPAAIQKYAVEAKALLERVGELSVPIIVDLKAGDSWGQMRKFAAFDGRKKRPGASSSHQFFD